MTPATCHAARALLNWPQKLLAFHSETSRAIVSGYESESSPVSKTQENKIQRALIDHGIKFLDYGVILRK